MSFEPSKKFGRVGQRDSLNISPENAVPRISANNQTRRQNGEKLSPAIAPARPSKEQQEILAKGWRLDWRRKLGNDQSIFREAYEYPKGLWKRDMCIFWTIWILIFGLVLGFWAWFDASDLVTLLLLFFGGGFALILILPVMYMDHRSTPKWAVLQLTRKYLFFTITESPAFNFVQMVRSENKLTYPKIAVDLEAITKVKKGFGSYFLREQPGSLGMMMVNIVHKMDPPNTKYNAEQELPVPITLLPVYLLKLKGAAHGVDIDPSLSYETK
jgi:hypothetical protein